MADKMKTVEIPKDAVAVEAHGALNTITQLLLTVPEPIRPWLEAELNSMIGKLIPRMAALTAGGPYVPLREVVSLEATFDGAADEATSSSAKAARLLTPAIRQIASELAKTVDSCVKTRMLTADNEKFINHEAWLDVIEGHAVLLRGITGLNHVPADYTDSRMDEVTH